MEHGAHPAANHELPRTRTREGWWFSCSVGRNNWRLWWAGINAVQDVHALSDIPMFQTPSTPQSLQPPRLALDISVPGRTLGCRRLKGRWRVGCAPTTTNSTP